MGALAVASLSSARSRAARSMEDGGDLGRDGLEGVDLGDRGRGGAGGGDVTQKKLLQGELERGDAGVGVDELIEQFEKRCEDGGPQGF